MPDYQTQLYNPIYEALGVSATLVLADATTLVITGIDKTVGVAVGNEVEVQTIEPAIAVRAAEIASVARADLEGATITFNGNTWLIVSFLPSPSPHGENDGEVYLILSDEVP